MRRVIILMYHIIDAPRASGEEKYCCTPANFERQMRFLRNSNYTPVSLDLFADSLEGQNTCPESSVIITFDDGFDNFMDKALPVLQKYDIPATVFIVSDRISASNDWMYTRGFPRRRLLSKSQLLELKEEGVCFGSHTRTHARLTEISNDKIDDEVVLSKKILEDILGSKVDCFAYPYGLFDEETRAAVVRAGYRTACSTRSGFNRLNIDRYALRRIEVYGSDSLQSFRRKLKFGANDVPVLYPLRYYGGRLATKLGFRQK